ncbi:MAG: peptidylprolyl isomerase [Nocardioides sp.]
MLSRTRLYSPARALAAVTANFCLTALSACGSEQDGQDAATDPAAGSCDYPSDGMPPAKAVEAPPATPTASGPVAVEMVTSAGTINAELDGAATPCTVNSFVSLAEQGYFDATQCHRLTTQGIFVLQCGDPTATGSGGPGYSFDDELTGAETYSAGTLAMANAGPGTNGSQFFLVYGDTQLEPNYTVFGQIDADSIAVVQKIADEGTQDGGPDGPPKTPVEVKSVTTG